MTLESTVGRVAPTTYRTSIGDFRWTPDNKVFGTESTSPSSPERAKRDAAEDFGRTVVRPHGEWLGNKLGVVHSLFRTNPDAAREYLHRMDAAFKQFDAEVADLVSTVATRASQ